jgi:hypothetical protein
MALLGEDNVTFSRAPLRASANNALLYAMLNAVQFAAVHILDRDGGKIYI